MATEPTPPIPKRASVSREECAAMNVELLHALRIILDKHDLPNPAEPLSAAVAVSCCIRLAASIVTMSDKKATGIEAQRRLDDPTSWHVFIVRGEERFTVEPWED